MSLFSYPHALINKGKTQQVLSLLIDNEDIAQAYKEDENHAWYLVGDTLYKEKKFDFALKCFKKSLFFNPKDYDAIFAIGDCYSELKKPERAFSFYKSVYKKTKNYNALYNMGNCFFDTHEYAEAIDIYIDIPAHAVSYKMARKNIEQCRKLIADNLSGPIR